MSTLAPEQLFTPETLSRLFPADRADQFFDALLGDAGEGAYDIRLAFTRHDAAAKTLTFALELHERPGKCLACNLTYGLPEVFARHPLINLKGVVAEIAALCGNATAKEWRLGTTQQVNKALHTVPLHIHLA
ncbi:MAG: pancreas/duodenum homeobox protein 1 [Thermodesulfobacteriota bacterium]